MTERAFRPVSHSSLTVSWESGPLRLVSKHRKKMAHGPINILQKDGNTDYPPNPRHHPNPISVVVVNVVSRRVHRSGTDTE